MANRFESKFDPNELNKITHRGLTKLNRAQFEERVTQEEVSHLKSRQRQEDSPIVGLTRFIAHFFTGIMSAIMSLFTPKKKRVGQCDLYGHVLKSGWSGPNPLCEDCGAKILSLKDVRGAVPKDQRSDTGTQDPFQKQDRKYVK